MVRDQMVNKLLPLLQAGSRKYTRAKYQERYICQCIIVKQNVISRNGVRTSTYT